MTETSVTIILPKPVRRTPPGIPHPDPDALPTGMVAIDQDDLVRLRLEAERYRVIMRESERLVDFYCMNRSLYQEKYLDEGDFLEDRHHHRLMTILSKMRQYDGEEGLVC